MKSLSFVSKSAKIPTKSFHGSDLLNRLNNIELTTVAYVKKVARTMTGGRDPRPVFFFDIDNCVSRLIPYLFKVLTSPCTALP